MADASLDQEQVWDDTDLLESWNAAFAEYMKYHSLAAKGQKVPQPPAVDNTNGVPHGNNPSLTTAATTNDHAEEDTASSDDYAPSLGEASKSGQSAGTGLPASSDAPSIGGPVMPQVLGGSVQDEAMKKLMMSWYYAGYYTGLHEGKQQGFASAVEQQQAAQGG